MAKSSTVETRHRPSKVSREISDISLPAFPVIGRHSCGPGPVPRTIVFLYLRHTIKDLFMIFIAQKAQDETSKLIPRHIELSTDCLVNQTIEILMVMLGILSRKLKRF